MTTMRNTLFGQIALGVTLTCMGAAAFAASNPNTYLNGTYMVGGFDSDPADFQLFVTFDGAGNGSATEIRNVGGVITTGTNSGTYTVASNGTFTLNTGTNTLTGGISADGNTLLLTQLGSGQNPEFDVGIKQGLISNFNVASGLVALASDTTGANNTAFGYAALYSNTSGKGNAAQGANALYSNISGIRNVAIGNNALLNSATGSYNLAVGMNAGSNQTTGNDNIYFSNVGAAGESQTLRLGTQGSAGVVGSGILSAYIAGIAGTQVTGTPVYVTSSGQLGTGAAIVGPTGPAGPTRPQGAAGAMGPAGTPGANGAQGANGPQGATGPQGMTGPQGATGPAGATGTGVPACTVSAPYMELYRGALVCQPRFNVNGDGTLTDNQTGLMWELATGTVGGTATSDVKDVNARYTWSTGDNNPDGTLYTAFLATLNSDASADATSTCFANHCDWRIPNIVELQTIVEATASGCASVSSPCIDSAFGATWTRYWSSSALAGNPNNVWNVDFYYGNPFDDYKTNLSFARAVRSGP